MNHGFKINNTTLEITITDNIHIDRVVVNRQIFSQRQRVCKSCKYHGLEGHEEPCVSCEVGNSNYVASVEQEERTEVRTETHACDLISRQDAITEFSCCELTPDGGIDANYAIDFLKHLPSVQPEPCEDAVSRHMLLSDLEELIVAWEKYPVMTEQRKGVEAAIGYVKTIPSAQPELDEWCYDCKEYDAERHCCPRWNRVIRETLKEAQTERPKGEWVLQSDDYHEYYECDQCGMAVGLDDVRNFCCNCGADMRGDSDE